MRFSAIKPARAAEQPRHGEAMRRGFRTLVVVFAATTCVFLLANLIGHSRMYVTVRVAVPMIVGDALIAVPLVWITVRAGESGWRDNWPIVVLLGIVVASLQAAWDTQVRLWVGAIKPALALAFLSSSLPIDIYNTGLLVSLLAFQAAYYRVIAQSDALVAARENERHASLAALRLQLNPHFLFNTMNALSSLVVTKRNADAETMIERLSEFLRHVLAADPARLERLDEEFALIEAYLAIEQVRFGDRLIVSTELPAALAHLAVPPFVLQPLVENAIKYGVTSTRRPVTIRVVATDEAPCLVLHVIDDGDPVEAGGGLGVGLANIRERLALLYGDDAALEAAPGLAGGFVSAIRLPLAAQPSPSAASSSGR